MSIDPAVVAVLLLALAWHEAAHAWTADRLGDPTARELGRVTLNPLKHLDPFLSVILPVIAYLSTGFVFGGGKPVPVNVGALHRPRRDFMLVALAGPGSNLVLALLFAVVFVVSVWTGALPPDEVDLGGGRMASLAPSMQSAMEAGGFLARLCYWGVLVNTLLAAFNLIPLPPLDGSRVVGWLLPSPLASAWYGLDRLGVLLLLAFLFLLDGFHYVALVFWPLYHVYDDFVTTALRWVPVA